jgi:hypothetical protein
MIPKLSEEQRQAIESKPGEPIEIVDDHTQGVYILVAREDFRKPIEDRLRRELQIAFDQVENGDVADWDVEEMLQEAHRRHLSSPHLHSDSSAS